jgi:hypothetical protein
MVRKRSHSSRLGVIISKKLDESRLILEDVKKFRTQNKKCRARVPFPTGEFVLWRIEARKMSGKLRWEGNDRARYHRP